MVVLNNYCDFFKDKSVRITCPFPKSSFRKQNINLKSEISYLIQGKERLFYISTQKYNEFLSLDMDKVIKYLYNFDYLSKRNRNTLISFTDIYFKNFKPIYKKKWTYAQQMYEQWTKFIKYAKKNCMVYKYLQYIDIENFYRNIYTHFIYALGINTFEKFKKIKFFNKKQRDTFFKGNNFSLLRKIEEKIRTKICFASETCGLPIGNGISDFIAEQLLLVVEYYLQQLVNNEKGFRLIRFRDDVFLFGDSKKTINLIYNKFKEVLLQFKIFINYDKTSAIKSDKNKIKFVEKREYKKEQIFKEHLIKKMGINLETAKKFTAKYPYSNKVFTIFRNILSSEYSITLGDLNKLLFLYRKSRTNTLPWLVSILDKTSNKQIIQKFLKLIHKTQLSESDIIWINCLAQKYKINNKSLKNINNASNQYVRDIIDKINTSTANFLGDTDTFNY